VLGKVLVRAGDRSPVVIPTFPNDATYLLFLRRQGDLLYTAHPPLLIRDGKLAYVYPFHSTNEPDNALQGLAVDDVARVVRNTKASPVAGDGILQPIGR
jgi:hypothetical protein